MIHIIIISSIVYKVKVQGSNPNVPIIISMGLILNKLLDVLGTFIKRPEQINLPFDSTFHFTMPSLGLLWLCLPSTLCLL